MVDITTNFLTYLAHASKAREILRKEHKIMLTNFKTIFYDGSIEKDYFLLSMSHDEYGSYKRFGFPEKFALPDLSL